MDIGGTIQQLRKFREMDQGELAKLAGISQSSMSLIELDKKKPRPKTVTKICKVLEIPEPLLYMLSISESDIPESKTEIYRQIFPAIRTLIYSMIE